MQFRRLFRCRFGRLTARWEGRVLDKERHFFERVCIGEGAVTVDDKFKEANEGRVLRSERLDAIMKRLGHTEVRSEHPFILKQARGALSL